MHLRLVAAALILAACSSSTAEPPADAGWCHPTPYLHGLPIYKCHDHAELFAWECSTTEAVPADCPVSSVDHPDVATNVVACCPRER